MSSPASKSPESHSSYPIPRGTVQVRKMEPKIRKFEIKYAEALKRLQDTPGRKAMGRPPWDNLSNDQASPQGAASGDDIETSAQREQHVVKGAAVIGRPRRRRLLDPIEQAPPVSQQQEPGHPQVDHDDLIRPKQHDPFIDDASSFGAPASANEQEVDDTLSLSMLRAAPPPIQQAYR